MQQGPDLAQLLGNSQVDAAGQARLLSQMISQLQNQEQPGLLQRLLSPQGIAGAAATGLAGALGGGEAALGVGVGALGGLQQLEEARRSAADEAIGTLSEQRDKALDRLEKAQNRISTLLQSNPDLFADPLTGESTIDPNLLGLLATGEDIRLDPTTRRKLARRDEMWQRRDQHFRDALEATDSLPDARVLTRGWLANMDWQASDEVVEALAQAMGTEEFDATLLNMYLDWGGVSGIQALIRSRELGLSLEDPEIMRGVHWQPPINEAGAGDALYLQLVGEMVKWQSDPENQDTVISIAKEAGQDIRKYSQMMAQQAFAGRQAHIDHYIKKTVGFSNAEESLRNSAIANTGDLFGLGDMFTSGKIAQKTQGMSLEEQMRYKGTIAMQMFQGLLDAQKGQSAVEDAQRHNALSLKLAQALKLDTEIASGLAMDVLLAAQRESVDPNGFRDEAKYLRAIETYTQQAIEQNRK